MTAPQTLHHEYLKDNGFTYYVVSGSDRFICRALTEAIGIPSNRVIGMDVKLVSSSQGTEAGVDYTMSQREDIVRTDELFIQPVTASAYCDRTWDFPYKIDHDDLCFRLFTARFSHILRPNRIKFAEK